MVMVAQDTKKNKIQLRSSFLRGFCFLGNLLTFKNLKIVKGFI